MAKGQWWMRGPCGRVGGERQENRRRQRGPGGSGSGDVSGLLSRAKYALIRGRAGAGSHFSKEGMMFESRKCADL